MKKILIIIVLLLIIIIFSNKDKKPVNYISPMYAYNTSIQEIAVGVSKYVFVGKINKIKTTKYIDNTPYTVYQVTNLKNIKGNLEKEIKVNQYGGINKDKKSYTFIENTGYLQKNTIYIFLVGITENKELEIADPNRIIKLPNKNINSKKNKSLIEEYKLAYENEEIPN